MAGRPPEEVYAYYSNGNTFGVFESRKDFIRASNLITTTTSMTPGRFYHDSKFLGHKFRLVSKTPFISLKGMTVDDIEYICFEERIGYRGTVKKFLQLVLSDTTLYGQKKNTIYALNKELKIVALFYNPVLAAIASKTKYSTIHSNIQFWKRKVKKLPKGIFSMKSKKNIKTPSLIFVNQKTYLALKKGYTILP